MTEGVVSVPCCATIGFFDGVHKGHRYIISQLMSEAGVRGMQSAVITFRQHPRQVLQQNYIPKLLTTSVRKESLLLSTGVDRVVMLDFTRELAAMSAREFMAYMRDDLNVRCLLIGYDNRFGHNRDEGFSDYQRYGQELGVDVKSLSAFSDNGLTVSSSMVRRMLTEGNILGANSCLGYRYTMSGVVVHGYGEGRKLGFPTANISASAEQLVPMRGVYAVKVRIEGFAGEYVGMLSIGNRPTFGEFGDTVEVNILDFSADIYGRTIEVMFAKRMRAEKKFATLDELISQLHEDKVMITRYFES